jgi:DNA-directed RNA polymerase beta subunit
MSSQSHDLPIVDGEQIRSLITIPPNGGREGELVLTPENVLLRKILEVDGFSSNTIETYNNWICNVLPRQISARSIKTEDGIVTFESALLLPQCEVIDGKTSPLTPLIVRERGQPYLANLYADLVFTPQNNTTGILTSTPSRSSKVSSRRRIRLGSIPAMLGSQTCWLYGKSATERVAMGECYTDPFGYFIIKGEKAILTQEKLRSSMFLTMIADVKGRVEGRITCNTILGTTIVTLLIGKKWQTLKVGLQHLGKQHHIPLFVLYRLFGYTFEMAWEMIKKFITDPKTLNRVYIVLQSSVAKAEGIPNPIDYLMNKIPRKSDDSSTGSNTGNIQQEIRDNIVKNLFAHIPNDPSKPEASIREKLLHMSLMTAKMCEYLIGQRMLDDRDSWSNKRLESAGRSMEQLFNGLWEKMTREAQENINKGRFTGIDAVEKTLNQSTLTDEFISSFGSNSWGVKGSYVKENITESLKRDTPLAVYSQIGRVNTPASRQAKQPAIRMVQPSQLGYICPFETPEGEGNGLVKNLALTCYLSQERNPSIIRGILMMAEFSAVQSLDKTSDHAHPILLNSRIVGWCNGPVLRDLLVGARRKALIAKDVCIFFHPRDRILEIYCDGARPTRPLLVVENGTLVIDRLELWNESLDTLLRTGCIEYIDAREQEYVKLAMSPAKVREHTENGGLLRLQYEIANTHNLETKAEILDRIKEWENIEPFTHSEIDPIAMFSIACGLIPMANREQGPRITYQASMGKQALGQYHTNHHLRFDTTFKMLLWSTRPTFETEVAEPAGLNLMPTGQTVITAFLALRNNGEDAIVVKEEAIAAGKFEVMKYMTHKAVVKKTSDVIETFCRPEAKGSNVGRYAAIDENGLPRLDAYIKQGDCIIGRIREYTKTGVRENASIFAGVGEEGYVDRIHITRNLERYYVAKVKIRQKREYRVGDKLSSRYSQKGVIAVVIPAHQLPRISGGPNDGVVPDFFVNPHSIPSRMTMGKMIEMLACKAALYTGERVNATSFRAFDIQRYRQILTNRGMDPDGYEKMVHPDGTPLQTPVFVGPCYYQALRHHVLDKFQMRSRGAIDPLSHQPVSGRANEGGLRFGEMERDGLISHAASSILLERLCTVSDAYKTIICSNCGSICIADHTSAKKYICRQCGPAAKFGSIEIPYPLKLLYHMLVAAGMDLRFKTENALAATGRKEERYLA